jgi:hypothetical protein
MRFTSGLSPRRHAASLGRREPNWPEFFVDPAMIIVVELEPLDCYLDPVVRLWCRGNARKAGLLFVITAVSRARIEVVFRPYRARTQLTMPIRYVS